MSQERLAAVGLTFQQIQKFESGANLVPASSLADIATALKASPVMEAIAEQIGRQKASRIAIPPPPILNWSIANNRIRLAPLGHGFGSTLAEPGAIGAGCGAAVDGPQALAPVRSHVT